MLIASTPPLSQALTPQALLWLVAVLSLAALPHASQTPAWLIPTFVTIAAWRALLILRAWPLPQRWLLVLLALLATAGVLFTYRSLFGRDAGIALLTVMSACKLLETRTLRDAVVLVFLGYLLIMSNLLFNQDIPMVAYLLLVLLLMLVAQILIYAQHSALAGMPVLRLAGKMLLSALPVMLVLFVLFPRIPGPLWGLPNDAYQGRTGLSGEMELGTINNLIRSSAVALRVRFAGELPPPAQRYWRGPVLWNFDGKRWMRRDELLSETPMPFTAQGESLDYTVIMEPSNQRWLLALDLPTTLPARTRMTPSFQLMHAQPVNEVLRYELRSYPRYITGALSNADRVAGLRLPPRSNPRARQLAESWRAHNAQPQAIVQAALQLFREQEFYYALNPPLLTANDGIDQFLFETRRGFCEHYASSLVFLMRAAGVPARIVTGYLGGERNAVGDYLIVRQSDAHSWVEVWLEERGWVRVDPTEAVAPNRIEQGLYEALSDASELPFLARRGGDYQWVRQLALTWDVLNIRWNEWVLAYGAERQKQFLSGLGFGAVDWAKMTMAMLVTLTGLGLVFLLLRWRKLRSADHITRAWQRFCASLARQGVIRNAHEGPLDFVQRAVRQRPRLAASMREIGALYVALRYGRTALSAEVNRLQWLTWRFYFTARFTRNAPQTSMRHSRQ